MSKAKKIIEGLGDSPESTPTATQTIKARKVELKQGSHPNVIVVTLDGLEVGNMNKESPMAKALIKKFKLKL